MHYRRKNKRYRHHKEQSIKYICPICSRSINKLLTTIVHRETGKKAHFDCVLKELKKYYNLKQKEELYYLGGGSFGIIEISKGVSKNGFIIKRRIQYEERNQH
jgi:hypothetical protein